MGKKNIKYIIIVAILAVIAGVVFVLLNNNIPCDSDIILFYGLGCPHCANVDKYMKDNAVKEKITICKKEVFYHKDNAKVFEEKAVACGLPTENLGVPFLWDGSGQFPKCYSGDQDIINFFKEKIGK